MNTIFSTPILMQSLNLAPRVKEKLDEKFIFMETASTAKMVDAEAAANGETRSDVLRRALEQYYAPKKPLESPETFTAPYVGEIPCGPWDSSQSTPQRYTISAQDADELGARPGDWFFRARGESMIGAGVLDSAVVLVRPYEGRPARRGDIVAVQIETADGEIEGTFKRYDGGEDENVRLLDGNGHYFELPENVARIGILARGVGVVSRL